MPSWSFWAQAQARPTKTPAPRTRVMASSRSSTQSRGLELEFGLKPVREGIERVHVELSADKELG